MNKKVLLAGVLLVVVVIIIFAFMGGGKMDENAYTVAVVTGTTFEEKARAMSKVGDVKLYEDDNQTLSELANGRVEVVITDRLVGLNGIQKGGYGNLRLAGDLLYQELCAVAFHQEDDSLRQAINQGLDAIIENGTYALISKKYFGRDILEGLNRPVTVINDEEATDGTWNKIKEKGVATFAMSGGYPPFNYYNENNELTGFDVEIARAVCEYLGVKYEPITTAWDGIIEGLRAKRYDGVWGSMAITDQRLEIVDFSDPYYISGAQLIVVEDSNIEGPETLQ
jgi:ABC-type amino acid transport substrate-binding protein